MTKFCSNFSIFGFIYRPLEVKIHPKVGLSRSKTMPKRFLKNFEKVQKTTLSTPKIVKNDPSKRQKWAKFWSKILIFGYIYRPFELKYNQKLGFQTQNNAQTVPKQLPINFEKVQKTTFSTPKIAKNDPSNRPKWANFGSKISIFEIIYRTLESIINT